MAPRSFLNSGSFRLCWADEASWAARVSGELAVACVFVGISFGTGSLS
jgi:hypothetical protein